MTKSNLSLFLVLGLAACSTEQNSDTSLEGVSAAHGPKVGQAPGSKDKATANNSTGAANSDFFLVDTIASVAMPSPDGEQAAKTPLCQTPDYTDPEPYKAPAVRLGKKCLYNSGAIAHTSVKQGPHTSCYFAASVAAIARTHPGVISQILRTDADKNHNVMFRDWWGWNTITIDGEEWDDGFNYSSYAAGWFNLVQKGFAKWKGGYFAAFGPSGGNTYNAMQALTGGDVKQINASELTLSFVKAHMNLPMLMSTYKEPVDPTLTTGWHEFVFVGLDETLPTYPKVKLYDVNGSGEEAFKTIALDIIKQSFDKVTVAMTFPTRPAPTPTEKWIPAKYTVPSKPSFVANERITFNFKHFELNNFWDVMVIRKYREDAPYLGEFVQHVGTMGKSSGTTDPLGMGFLPGKYIITSSVDESYNHKVDSRQVFEVTPERRVCRNLNSTDQGFGYYTYCCDTADRTQSDWRVGNSTTLERWNGSCSSYGVYWP